ncbi:disease resistance protein RPM1-like [Neltuma alba]|uniref:disease resistance protein RPM1-like n=1 Tax=Neltuma alba TaxID=207710 RepID=UPI0010A46E44|nr:disease resistance protein RPM1-like [Prosopis alba]
MAKKVVEFRLNELFQVLNEEFQLKRGAEQDIVSIKRQVKSIRAFLGSIDDNKLEYEDQSLESWINRVRDVAYEIEDIVDEFLLYIFEHRWDEDRPHTSPSCSFVRNCKTNYKIGSELRNIRAKIKGIPDKPRKYDVVSSVVPESSKMTHQFRSSLYNVVDEGQLVGVGRMEAKETLLGCLLEGDDSAMNKVVAIVAEGGMGKTTMARQIHHHGYIRECFKKIVFVTLSQSLNEEELLTDMVQQLCNVGSQEILSHTMSTHELKETMKGLIQSARYLIVLDDVWKKEHWDCVKLAFPNEHCASRILITTRNEEVARYATTCDDSQGTMFHLQRLSESDSWGLFCKKTFSSQPCPPHLEPICRQMVDKCEGLPLAISVLSGLLGTKNKNRVEEWVMVQRILDNVELKGNINPRLNKVLSLAFDDLPYNLKPCFLLLSVFPENHLIEPMRLVRLWVSDGNNKMTEEVAESYLCELLNRNLIQIAKYTLDGRIMCFRIHDLIHETVVLKSRAISFAEPITNEENARNTFLDKVKLTRW